MRSYFTGLFLFFVWSFTPIVASHAQTQPQSPQLLEGAFDAGPIHGGLELRLDPQNTAAPLSIKVSPRGRLETPTPANTTVTAQSVSFAADVGGVSYTFTGARNGAGWTGIMTPTTQNSANQGAAAGTWRASPAALAALPQPLDILPAPTGEFTVGRIQFQWTDDKRPELETKDPADKRRLLVHIFYPAVKPGAAQPAAYIPDGELMRSVWKDDLTNRLLPLKTHAYADAAISLKRGRYPVLVFAPGGGQKALSYTALLEDLASRGFIVAAIEFPHNAPAMQWPDGAILTRATAADSGWPEATTREEHSRIYAQQVEHWARDMSFVLDQLAVLNKGGSRLSGRIDIEHAGAIGHSKGGMAAGMARLIDPRFKGAMNIDGSDLGRGLITPPDGQPGKQPFLWLEKQFKQPTPEEFTQAGITPAEFDALAADGDRLLAGVAGGSNHVVIAQPGLTHLDFGDYGFWTSATDSTARAAKLRTLRVVAGYAMVFFSGALYGEWGSYQRLASDYATLPEVSVRHFGPVWK